VLSVDDKWGNSALDFICTTTEYVNGGAIPNWVMAEKTEQRKARYLGPEAAFWGNMVKH
jgi:hypothetical protein